MFVIVLKDQWFRYSATPVGHGFARPKQLHILFGGTPKECKHNLLKTYSYKVQPT
jgi:hypothetical protein